MKQIILLLLLLLSIVSCVVFSYTDTEDDYYTPEPFILGPEVTPPSGCVDGVDC